MNMKNRFLSGILVLLCLFAFVGCENSKSITGTVVYNYGNYVIHVSDDSNGASEGLYRMASEAPNDPEFAVGDKIEIQYSNLIGTKYNDIPNEPVLLDGVTEIDILGKADDGDCEAGVSEYESYAAEAEAYADKYHLGAAERMNADIETAAEAKGIAVKLDPLTVYISDPLPEKGVDPGFYTVETYRVNSVPDIKTGQELLITFSAETGTEPRYIYDVSDIEISGEASKEKINELSGSYDDYMAQLKYVIDNRMTVTVPTRNPLVEGTGTIVKADDEGIFIYSEDIYDTISTGTKEPSSKEYFFYFLSPHYPQDTLNPKTGQQMSFWYTIDDGGYAEKDGAHILGPIIFSKNNGKAGDADFEKMVKLYEENKQNWELEMKKITG